MLCFVSTFRHRPSPELKNNLIHWHCVLALVLDYLSVAKQLCRLEQESTVLYVSYLQWNLYEPEVTSTWMGPSVLVPIWCHLISEHGTHSLKLWHMGACMYFKGGLTSLMLQCIDLNKVQICLTHFCHFELGNITESIFLLNAAINICVHVCVVCVYQFSYLIKDKTHQ